MAGFGLVDRDNVFWVGVDVLQHSRGHDGLCHRVPNCHPMPWLHFCCFPVGLPWSTPSEGQQRPELNSAVDLSWTLKPLYDTYLNYCIFTFVNNRIHVPSYQVCDQPHPLLVAQLIKNCLDCNLQPAYVKMKVCPAIAAAVVRTAPANRKRSCC